MNSGLNQYHSIKYLIANLCCLVGPAIFVHRTLAAKLHRKLWAKAWPKKTRWQWCLLLSISLLSWYLCFFWVQLYACLNVTAYQILKSKGIGANRQLADMLYLGLWLGGRPSDYYRFRLYRVDRSRWLNHVFSQEQPVWHSVHSCPPGTASALLVNDKYSMESRLRESGIETTTTLAQLEKSAAIDQSQIFLKRNLFIKPNSANAMRGCLLLEYGVENDSYELSGFDLQGSDVCLKGEADICCFLEETLRQEKLLIQEPLINSEEVSEYAETQELVTLKVVSGANNGQVHLAYILLEVPDENQGLWRVYPVNLETGIPEQPQDIEASDQLLLKAAEKGCALCNIDELRITLEKAHTLVPDIKTLTWDLAVTQKGLSIIEANTGWDIVSPQQIAGVPLLESKVLNALV